MPEYIRAMKRSQKSPVSRLSRLDIELTERCNNDCVHCCINLPVDDESARKREMSTAQVEAILDGAAALGCLEVRFTGGEPLLRGDFAELYLHARKLGLKVLLFTNARLLTEELVDLFARVPPLIRIEVTVYGMSEASYASATRVPGTYAQFRRGVDLLLSLKVPFIVKAAYLPSFKRDVESFEAWTDTIPWMNKAPGYSMFFDLRNRRDSEEKNRLIRKQRVTPEEGLALLTRRPQAYRKGMEEFGSKFMGPPGDRLFGCGAGHGICVDAYGKAQPCMGIRVPELCVDLFDNPVYGEGEASPLSFALERFKQLADRKAQDPEYLRRCAVCFLKGLCEQCPAKSWAECGALDRPIEYLCEMAHAQARWLGWLNEGEHAWEVKDWKRRLESEN
ncbi:MAG TPA: radical SAM protein [Rectinemataceae bacterium]|nr:radical SAM protein [Rectinemataceae bacterium]